MAKKKAAKKTSKTVEAGTDTVTASIGITIPASTTYGGVRIDLSSTQRVLCGETMEFATMRVQGVLIDLMHGSVNSVFGDLNHLVAKKAADAKKGR